MEENRKVRLTKKVLKETLVELLLVKNIAKISVTELCDKADVNRSTFYSHYSGLEAVLNEIEDELAEWIFDLTSKIRGIV